MANSRTTETKLWNCDNRAFIIALKIWTADGRTLQYAADIASSRNGQQMSAKSRQRKWKHEIQIALLTELDTWSGCWAATPHRGPALGQGRHHLSNARTSSAVSGPPDRICSPSNKQLEDCKDPGSQTRQSQPSNTTAPLLEKKTVTTGTSQRSGTADSVRHAFKRSFHGQLIGLNSGV